MSSRSHRGLLAAGAAFLTCLTAVCLAGPAMAASGGPGTENLYAGQCLTSNQALDDGLLALVMGSDGNMVMTDQSHAVWANGKTGYPGARLCMQGDGNLVEYTTSNVAVWSSGTAGHSGAYAVLAGFQGFSVYSASSRLWGTPLPNTAFTISSQDPPDVLFAGQSLGAPGFEMLDRNSYYSLYEYQGYLEEYQNGTQNLLWYAGSYCSGNSQTDMQSDGNLVTYCNGSAIWSSGTGGHPSSYGIYLHLQTDGNVVLYSNYGRSYWANGV